MYTLQAVIRGKVVTYPSETTFILERRTRRTQFSLMGTKNNIEGAVAKYHRLAIPGTTTRLSCTTEKGRIKVLHEEAISINART